MDWITHVPAVVFALIVFAFGLAIGSFLNVLIARLPFEKSPAWPGSRCFSCLRPLRPLDNLPIIGYLRLRGRCRFCQSPFSARYLWVELGTGVAFVALFLLEIVFNVHGIRGLTGFAAVPTFAGIVYLAAHAALLSLLIASAVIDLKYFFIPQQITLAGTVLGLIASTLFPWPWPNPLSAVPVLPGTEELGWADPKYEGRIPSGLALWPVWGPLPDWAPAGSWQLGLLTGVVGAVVGQMVGRAVKFLFEVGFGREALGLGDADLLMMAGAILGWQVTVLALPAGAMILLPIVIPIKIWVWASGRWKPRADTGRPEDDPSALPFGPGIALGVVACWLGWPWLAELVRSSFFTSWLLWGMALFLGGGLLVAGVLTRFIRGGGSPQG